MRRLATLVLPAALLAACSPDAPAPLEVDAGPPALARHAPVDPVVVDGTGGLFVLPESAVYDADADAIYVSNIGADVFGPSNDGFVARLAPDGSVLDARWITGTSHSLVSPTGLAVSGDELYAVDRMGVHAYDRATGAWLRTVEIPGAAFLNDVCVGSEGELYVTDTAVGADLAPLPGVPPAIYRIDGGDVSVFASGDHLNQPNGCATLGANVVVTTFSSAAELYRVNAAGKKKVIGTLPAGAGLIDSVQRVGGSWFLSSWEAEGVYRMPLGGGAAEKVLDLASPADMGYDPVRGHLLVPSLFGNTLVLLPVE